MPAWIALWQRVRTIPLRPLEDGPAFNWSQAMKVNVFTRTEGAHETWMLAVLASPEQPAPTQFHKRWQYVGTADTSDAMFRSVKVEDDISARGYCVFTP